MRGEQASRLKGVSRYYVCSQRALYGSCAAPIVRADILEEELCRWLGTCHPDDRLEQTARELVERGLKQRRTNWREWDERLSVKALEARLERTRKLWIVYGDMTRDRVSRRARGHREGDRPGSSVTRGGHHQAVLAPDH